MTYTVITNQSEWNIMLGVTGKKMIYIVSDRCDGRRTSGEWAENYEGTNVDYLYLVAFEDLPGDMYNLLTTNNISELPAILYYNNSTLEWGREGLGPETENRVKEQYEYANGDDVIAYDTDNDQLVVLSGKSVNHITMPSRYITNGDVLLGVNDGHVHAVSPDFATAYGVNDNTAASYSHYRIEIPSSNGNAINAGSFDYTWVLMTSGTTTTTGTVTWSAGASLSSIRSQITSVNASYGTTAVTTDQQAIGVSSGGDGANTFTITNATGCTLIDMTTLAIFDESRTVRARDSYDSSKPVINSNHKNWRGALSSNILNTYLTGIGKVGLSTSTIYCYAENGCNYYYRIIVNLEYGYAYWKTGGNASFLSDGVNGSYLSSSNINPMKETVFNSNVTSSATGDAGKMYAYYSALQAGTGGYKELHDKLLNKFGSFLETNNTLYIWYLAAHSTNLDSRSGIINLVRNKGVYETHIMGRVFTVDYNYKYYPAYPPEYNTLRYEEQTPIYQYINDNVNNSQYEVDGDIEIYSTCEPWDLGWIYNDLMIPKINSRQSDSWLGLVDYTNVAYNNYTGSFAQYYAPNSWLYSSPYRILSTSSRYTAYFHSRPVATYYIN